MPSFIESAKKHLATGNAALVPIISQYICQERVESEEGQWVKELFLRAYSPELRLSSMLWLLKQHRYLNDLSAETGFSESALLEAIQSSPRIVRFPVLDCEGSSCLARAMVYVISSSHPRALALCGSRNLECSHLAELSGISCVIGFDMNIEGRSWQLAVLAALLDKNVIARDDLAFSGVVLEKGEIAPAESIIAKNTCCEAQEINLVSRVKTTSQLQEWLNSHIIPLPVLQYNGSENELRSWQTLLEVMVKESYAWFSYELLEDFHGITRKDLAISESVNLAFEAKAWQDFLGHQVQNRFDSLEHRLLPKKALWFYAGQISALQLGIGAIFGFKRALAILQLDFSSSSYKQVFTLHGSQNARELKNVSISDKACKKVEGHLQITEPESKELGLIIYLGSHNPIGEAQEFCRTQLQVRNFLVIKAKENQGVLDLKENWLRWIQEINSLLNHAREEYHWKRIHLFQTAPTAICMALGIAIGHFLPMDVYHYQFGAEEPKYRKVFSMDRVMSYKEVEI